MLSLLIDGVEHISKLVHESLTINQTNDGLNSTCSFTIRDADVVQKNAWTVGVSIVGGSDVISGHVAFSEPKVEVSITDGATVYFAGILSRIETAPAGLIKVGAYIEPRHQMLRCACHDFNALLEESIIDSLEEYTNMTDEAIIDDIFATYVTGIDFATHVTTVYTFKSISFENITVRQALDLIVDRSGAVWYVDYSKKLHYAEEEANAPAWYLSDVPDQVTSFSYLDLKNDARSIDATNLVNMVFIVSSETGTWFTDAASRAKYGDHKYIVRDARLSITESIAARGNAILDKFKDPVTVYTVRTYKDGLRAGMHVRFVCAYLDIDATFLINRLMVTFPVSGEPLYEMELGGLASSIGGSARRLDVDHIYTEQPITSTQLPLASRGWGHDMTFSATDADTVAWTAGTLTTASGQTFSINAGNTDDPASMLNKTIVYLDTVISLTDLQMTTVETAAIGNNRIMVAVAWPSGVAGVDAGFQVFGSTAELATYLNATNVITNCLTANEFYGNSLAVMAANIGILTIEAAGEIRSYTNVWDANADGFRITHDEIAGQLAGVDQIVLSRATGKLTAGAGAVTLDVDGINITGGKFSMVTAAAGNHRIEIDNTEIVGYDGADTKQFYLSAATGKAHAGAGAVTLDASGVTWAAGAAGVNYAKWESGADIIAIVYGQDGGIGNTQELILRGDAKENTSLGRVIISGTGVGAGNADFYLISGKLAADNPEARIDLGAASMWRLTEDGVRILKGLYVGADIAPTDDNIWVVDDVRIGGGLVVGSLADNPASGYARVDKGLYVGDKTKEADDNDIWCDGEISTDGGTRKWELSAYAAGVPVATGSVAIRINGVLYALLARQV